MAAPAKFLFDMDFSAPDKTRERPATPSEIAQKIASAEARAYRDGFDAGQREAASPALKPGWRPKLSTSQSRSRASCATR
jgi:hypothetical protein